MSTSRAIRFVASKSGSNGVLHLACRVKPGVSSQRAGITAIDGSMIELCVAAQPRDGGANKEVQELIAKILKVPKSDVQIAKGLKSRDKVVAVTGLLRSISSIDQRVSEVERMLKESSVS